MDEEISSGLSRLFALSLEAILFGLFSTLVLTTIGVFVYYGKPNASSKSTLNAIVVMLAMFALGGASIVNDIFRSADTFVVQAKSRNALLSEALARSSTARIYIVCTQILLGSLFVLYRTYLASRKIPCVVPLTALYVSTSLGAVSVYGVSDVPWNVSVIEATPLPLALVSLSFINNLTCTAVLSFSTWRNQAKAGTFTEEGIISQILHIAVDSGAIYSMMFVAFACAYASGAVSAHVISDSLVQIIGIVATLNTMHVVIGCSPGDSFEAEDRKWLTQEDLKTMPAQEKSISSFEM